MQGAEHQVAGLGCFEGGGERFLVADLTHQDHVRVFAKCRPQGVVELQRVHPHLPMSDQGAAAFMHELHRILDREDVPGLVAIDPVDHRGEGGALA